MKLKVNKVYFLIRFVFYYNFFGNMYLLGSIIPISVFVYFNNRLENRFYYSIILVLCLVVSIYFLFKAILVISSFNKKFQYYRLSILRLEKKGYKPEYFKMGLFEPCMRIITRDILVQYGYRSKYSKLISAYGGEDPYINRAKEKLISSLNADEEKVQFIKKRGV